MLRLAFPAAFALAALTGAAATTTARAAEPRVVEISAHRFEFTPSVVTLRRDEPVVLRVRSEDVVHGFFQRPLGIDASLRPGTVTEVRLTPHETGRFVVICHHFCGAGHGNMKMTLVVE